MTDTRQGLFTAGTKPRESPIGGLLRSPYQVQVLTHSFNGPSSLGSCLISWVHGRHRGDKEGYHSLHLAKELRLIRRQITGTCGESIILN